MKEIKTTNNLEFDLIYGDGSKERVKEGVLFEVKGNKVLFHSGTSRPEVILALPEAVTEVISKAKLTDIFLQYIEKKSDRILGNDWIPVEERLPEDDKYILVSFENFSSADIARYEADENGGAFYPGDEEKSYVSFGLFVNAWMPLPEAYRPEK